MTFVDKGKFYTYFKKETTPIDYMKKIIVFNV